MPREIGGASGVLRLWVIVAPTALGSLRTGAQSWTPVFAPPKKMPTFSVTIPPTGSVAIREKAARDGLPLRGGGRR
jgi:hypothetical protein